MAISDTNVKEAAQKAGTIKKQHDVHGNELHTANCKLTGESFTFWTYGAAEFWLWLQYNLHARH